MLEQVVCPVRYGIESPLSPLASGYSGQAKTQEVNDDDTVNHV